MKIFNVEIFGSDADYFIALSCEAKKKWILDNTNVTDKTLIKEFIESVVRGTDECEGCKKSKTKSNGITKTVSEKTTAATESKSDTRNSRSGNNKGAGLADRPEGSGV
jgi:hypothetical protein